MISVHKMPNDFCSYPNSNKCMMHKDISKWVVYFYAAAGPILALMVAAILPVGTNQGSILELFQDALKDGVLVFSGVLEILCQSIIIYKIGLTNVREIQL